MLALAQKYTNPYSHNAVAHHAANLSKKTLKAHQKLDLKLNPSISAETIDKIETFRLFLFPEGMDVGRDITHLDAKNICDHARELDKGNEYYRNMAKYLFYIAAEKGDLVALRILGLKTIENSADPHFGIAFLKEAAELGEVGAMLILGGYHLRGAHVEQDLEMALSYYKQAEDSGYPKARNFVERLTYFMQHPNPKQAADLWLSEMNNNSSRE